MQVVAFIPKADTRFEADFDKLPKNTQEYIINYGWKQAIADSCASAEKGNTGQALGMCQKRYDNLLKGVIRAERESDPVAREAKRLAIEAVNRALRKAGKDPKEVENLAELVAKAASDPKIAAQAQANVDAMAGLDIEIDLG